MKTALDNISPEEALEVLNRLCASDVRLRARILSEAKKLLSCVDTDEIVQEVYDQLDAIDVHCMGVLRGIYDFEHKSKSEFKDWATNRPAECFGDLLDNWRRACPRGDIEEMNRFIAEQCPGNAQWAIKKRGQSG